MTFSQAALVSLIGDAKLVRHFYVPSTTLSYLAYTADVEGQGDYIWYRPLLAPDDVNQATRPAIGDEVRITLPRGLIRAFYPLPLSTDDQVMFVFEDESEKIWRLIRDVANHVTVVEAEELFDGERPTLDFDGFVRTLYRRLGDVLIRTDFGDPSVIVTPSERDIFDLDIKFKEASSIVSYAGAHYLANDIALRFLPDANTVICYDGETGATGDTVEFPDIINPGTNQAIIQDQAEFILNAAMPGGGLQGDGVRFQGNTGRLNAFGSFFPANLDEITIMIWLYGDTDLPQTTSFFRGSRSNLNAHIPWSNSNVYWDVYQNNDPLGGTLDRVNYNAGTTTEGAWRHWAFTHNTNTGNHRIYRDGVQQISTSGKFNTVLATGNFIPINLYSGWCSEMAICDVELTQPEIDAARTLGLAGTPLSLASVPDLIHYWPMNFNPSNGFLDKSGNDAHAGIPSYGWLSQDEGFISTIRSSFLIGAFTWPGAITLEAWITPALKDPSFLPFDGDMSLEIKNTGIIELRFGSTVWRGRSAFLRARERVHVSVSHTFGDGSNTFVALNGQAAIGDWVTGDGTESPALSGRLQCVMGLGDAVHQIRVSNVARSLDYIRGHVGGRS